MSSELDAAALEHDLTDNALAFLHRSVEGMRCDPEDPRTASFAIVDLAVAVEVLMKARLVRVDWTLICDRPARATAAEVMAGSAITIKPAKAVALLDESNVPITSSGLADRVSEVSRLRNRAIHFTLTMDGTLPIAVQASYGRGLDFVLWFLNSEFREQVGQKTSDLVEDAIETLTTEVGHIEDLVEARMATIDDELDGADVCVECPRCRQPALMFIEGAPARCAFCLWNPSDGENIAFEYTENVLGLAHYTVGTDGGTWPIEHCIWCSDEALVEGIAARRQAGPPTLGVLHCDGQARAHWGCFSCGITAGPSDIERCTRCDRATGTGDGGVAICADCYAEILSDY
ncbi:hypothetical protein [Nocardia brasiliensis]|uniref:hypothetical protein n=1 Tax=Nocardia brasiliensis TaxID=37326 RepID=UPI003D922E03